MAKKVHRNVPGKLQPMLHNWVNPEWDGDPRPGMEAARLRRDGQPFDKQAANQLARKIKAERERRIREQGHA